MSGKGRFQAALGASGVLLLGLLLFSATVSARRDGTQIPGTVADNPTLCAQPSCHGMAALNAGGSVTLSGAPSAWQPGVTYDFTVTITGGTVYGTQITAFFAADRSQAGTLTPVTPGLVLQTAKTPDVLVHSPIPLPSGNVAFRWTAPLTGQGDIVIRLAANSANDNFAPTGDRINTAEVTIPMAQQTFAQQLFFAQFGDGGGITSDLVLVNPSSSKTATGEVFLRGNDGQPIDASTILPVSGTTIPFTLGPLASQTYTTTGTGAAQAGSVEVGSDIPIAGVVRFSIQGVGIAGVGSSQPATAVLAPVRRQGALSTGVAIQNLGDAALTVDLTLKGEDGKVVANGTIQKSLPARGHLAAFINELFPGADTTTFSGTLCVRAQSGQISVVALELDATASQFTTLPVTPIQ